MVRITTLPSLRSLMVAPILAISPGLWYLFWFTSQWEWEDYSRGFHLALFILTVHTIVREPVGDSASY